MRIIRVDPFDLEVGDIIVDPREPYIDEELGHFTIRHVDSSDSGTVLLFEGWDDEDYVIVAETVGLVLQEGSKRDGWPTATRRTGVTPDDPRIKAAAELVHRNESLHRHDDLDATVCGYCALVARYAVIAIDTMEARKEMCSVCGQPDNCGDCNHTPVLEGT